MLKGTLHLLRIAAKAAVFLVAAAALVLAVLPLLLGFLMPLALLVAAFGLLRLAWRLLSPRQICRCQREAVPRNALR